MSRVVSRVGSSSIGCSGDTVQGESRARSAAVHQDDTRKDDGHWADTVMKFGIQDYSHM